LVRPRLAASSIVESIWPRRRILPPPEPSHEIAVQLMTKGTNSYDANMAAGKPYIILKLETKNPIELGNFVSEFTSVASQYDKFIKERYPHLAAEAEIL
jgi:hypothetical protein